MERKRKRRIIFSWSLRRSVALFLRRSVALLLAQLGQPEVQHLHDTIFAQHDVFRLDVTMNNSVLVGDGKRSGDLYGDVQCSVWPQALLWRVLQMLAERLAFDVLGYDVVSAASFLRRFADLMDGDDIRMIERRDGVCFLLEAPYPVGIGRKPGGQQLNGHLTPQP